MMIERSAANGDAVMLSKGRSRELQESLQGSGHETDAYFEAPESAPSLGPNIWVVLLHNVSVGAAIAIWIDVCRAALRVDNNSSEAQTLYGRLLAFNAVCELITSQLVGSFSDRFGRRPLQVSAQVGQVVDYGFAALVLPALGLFPHWQVSAATVVPLLYLTRGFAGLAGNYRVSVQSYVADISSKGDLPRNLGYVGGSIVLGICGGSGLVAAGSFFEIPYRACNYLACGANTACILIAIFLWRDIAPKKDITCAMLSPAASIRMLCKSPSMVTYSALIFLASFSLNLFTSTITNHVEAFLGMSKVFFSLLAIAWAVMSAIAMGVVQPWMCRKIGEIKTLQVAFIILVLYYFLFSFVTEEYYYLAFPLIPACSLGAMNYPLAVGLATREVDADEQGKLQGAISILETLGKIVAPLLASDLIIPNFDKPGDFHGMVYLVGAIIVAPAVPLCFQQEKRMTLLSKASIAEMEVAS